MKFFLKTLSFLMICFLPVLGNAQQNSGAGTSTIMSEKAQREKAKKDAKEKRKQEKIHDKEVKEYQKSTQTKKVRKRMKKDKRRANLNNEHKREFFLIRWFSKS